MTATHNAVKKNHYYLHEILNRTWAVLSQVYSEEDLKKMGLKEDLDWATPPPKKYKKVKVPSLVASSYSSSRDTDEHEDLDDTAAGPSTTNDPNNADAPSSPWYSSGALVLIFDPFGHLMTKGEKFELVFKRVYLMGIFLSYNSRSSDDFVGSSCKLKHYGGLILLLFLLHAYSSLILLHTCWITSVTIFHHAFQILHILCQMRVWITRYRGDLHDSTLQVCIASKANSSLCTSSGGVLLYLAIKFLNIGIYTSYVYPRWKLNLYCHQSPKRGRL